MKNLKKLSVCLGLFIFVGLCNISNANASGHWLHSTWDFEGEYWNGEISIQYAEMNEWYKGKLKIYHNNPALHGAVGYECSIGGPILIKQDRLVVKSEKCEMFWGTKRIPTNIEYTFFIVRHLDDDTAVGYFSDKGDSYDSIFENLTSTSGITLERR